MSVTPGRRPTARAGSSPSNCLKAVRSMQATVTGPAADTVAARGWPSMSESSPKYSSDTTSRSPPIDGATSTSPLSITTNESPGSPCCTMTSSLR